MFSAFLAVLTFIIGVFFGVFYARVLEIIKQLKEIHKKVEEKQSKVTLPSYYPVPNTKQTAQVISPKTPQQLEREANQKYPEYLKR